MVGTCLGQVTDVSRRRARLRSPRGMSRLAWPLVEGLLLLLRRRAFRSAPRLPPVPGQDGPERGAGSLAKRRRGCWPPLVRPKPSPPARPFGQAGVGAWPRLSLWGAEVPDESRDRTPWGEAAGQEGASEALRSVASCLAQPAGRPGRAPLAMGLGTTAEARGTQGPRLPGQARSGSRPGWGPSARHISSPCRFRVLGPIMGRLLSGSLWARWLSQNLRGQFLVCSQGPWSQVQHGCKDPAWACWGGGGGE